ncbi:hypothetical protein ACFL0N_01060 [Pseudomonadota bacterium]
MNIEAIAKTLNRLLESTSLANFQRQRSDRLKRKCMSLAVFSATTIHNDYAYHHGGRGEIQFNIGLDDPDIFRFGIALSLEPDRTITDPVTVLESRFDTLNNYLTEYGEQFTELTIWREYDGQRFTLPKIQRLPDSWLSVGSFIFIGASFNDQSKRSDLTNEEYREVIRVFEQLLPVYQHVENSTNVSDKLRAARIVWNENGWTRPSGPRGKVKNPKNYEHIHGFGHEEWLFDLTKQIDGWKYGFLQTFYHNHKTYQGEQFDVLLYSIDSATKKRYWIARIAHMECITSDQAQSVIATCLRERWLEEMAEQVDDVGGESSVLGSAQPLEIVNCRFREKDLQLFGNDNIWPELQGNVIRAFYYDTFTKLSPESFYSLIGEPSQTNSIEISGDLSGYDGSGVKARIAKHRKKTSGEKYVDLRHKQWQLQLLKMLRERFGETNAGMEYPMGTGSADLLVTNKKNRLIIEVKTGHSASSIIREAFGQLLEYAYWPGIENKNIFLAIVGTPRLDRQSREYIDFLRGNFSIPVSYFRWNPESPNIQGLVELIDG